MQIGAMSDPLRSLSEEIDWISSHGFDYVELVMEAPGASLEGTDWRQVRRLIDDHQLGVVCYAAQYLPVENPSPLVRQAAIDELRRSLDAAQLLGAALCTTHFRGWPPYLADREGYEYYRQLFDIVVRHGQERGVTVALKNSAANRHQLKHFREIFHLVPGLRLTFDVGHGNIGTAKSMTRDYLFALADRLAHVHMSDNNGHADDHLPFGAPQSGGIDLTHELRSLRSFRYDAGITVEVHGSRRWQHASAELLRESWETNA